MARNSVRESRIARHRRVRKKVKGTPERPRMSVFRSARHIYAQIIDDTTAVTLASASTLSEAFRKTTGEGGKKGAAQWVGAEIARQAKEKGVEQVVFDRGGYKFHGRVKSLAEAAKESGLKL
ncbi:MAG: 50S ribosomal protein L18 [bacterium]|nr:50S ribosomal protein L18 [bacterium]